VLGEEFAVNDPRSVFQYNPPSNALNVTRQHVHSNASGSTCFERETRLKGEERLNEPCVQNDHKCGACM